VYRARGRPAFPSHFATACFTQAMKFAAGSPVRSAIVWPWPQTVAKRNS